MEDNTEKTRIIGYEKAILRDALGEVDDKQNHIVIVDGYVSDIPGHSLA